MLAMMVVTMMIMIPVMMMNRNQNKFVVNILFFIFSLADQKAPIRGIKEAMDQRIASKPVFIISKSYWPCA